jgi:hypothetical protein
LNELTDRLTDRLAVECSFLQAVKWLSDPPPKTTIAEATPRQIYILEPPIYRRSIAAPSSSSAYATSSLVAGSRQETLRSGKTRGCKQQFLGMRKNAGLQKSDKKLGRSYQEELISASIHSSFGSLGTR